MASSSLPAATAEMIEAASGAGGTRRSSGRWRRAGAGGGWRAGGRRHPWPAASLPPARRGGPRWCVLRRCIADHGDARRHGRRAHRGRTTGGLGRLGTPRRGPDGRHGRQTGRRRAGGRRRGGGGTGRRCLRCPDHEGRDQLRLHHWRLDWGGRGRGRDRHGEIPAGKDEVRIVEHPAAVGAPPVGVPDGGPGPVIAELVLGDGRERLTPDDHMRCASAPTGTETTPGATGVASQGRRLYSYGRGRGPPWHRHAAAEPTDPVASTTAPTSRPATRWGPSHARAVQHGPPSYRGDELGHDRPGHLEPCHPDDEREGLDPERVAQTVAKKPAAPALRRASVPAEANPRYGPAPAVCPRQG